MNVKQIANIDTDTDTTVIYLPMLCQCFIITSPSLTLGKQSDIYKVGSKTQRLI